MYPRKNTQDKAKKARLTNVLKAFANRISFHTPGHGGALRCPGFFDVTESDRTDNLLNPVGVLKDLEDTAARAYGAVACLLSTNGATCCVLTAVYTLKTYGGFMILGNAHSSVHNALKISRSRAYRFNNLPAVPPTDIKTLIVTYPDYFGRCADIKACKEYADRHGLFLLADSSHGSHFAFSTKLPVAASLYADLTVYSLHKTLPVATGGAVLAVGRRELVAAAVMSRRLFHSTSPSYITLASVDKAIAELMEKGEKLYERVFSELERFEKRLDSRFQIERGGDATRLVISGGFDGESVKKWLERRGIDIEMSFENKIVAIVTPYNCRKLGKLLRTLGKLVNPPAYDCRFSGDAEAAEGVLSFEDTGFELVPLHNAAGRIAYCDMGLYPPGTPLVRAGEVISDRAAAVLSRNPDAVFGLVNAAAAVLLYNNGD